MSAVEKRTIRRDPADIMRRLQSHFETVGKVNPKPGGRSFTAMCPCHDDTKPSLQITSGDKCVLVKCWACEATAESVLAAIGLPDPDLSGEVMTPASLFYETTMLVDEDGKRTRKSSSTKPKAKAKSAAAAVAQSSKVVSIDKATQPPKRFGSSVAETDRKRLTDDSVILARLDAERGIDADTARSAGLGLGADGRIILPTYDRDGEPAPRRWLAFADQRAAAGDDVPKMKGPGGAKPDLYPRPESSAFVDGSHVYLVEGEPDALCGVSHGLPVIGCPGTKGWVEADAARFVRFGRVTVIADADTFGREWAAGVERDLRAAGVRVVVRDFGDRVSKGFDLTDFALKCRADNVALSEAVGQLPMIVAGSQTTDLFGEPEAEAVANVGGCLFHRGAVHNFFGKGGAGKTYAALTAARDEIRNGGRVLFIDYESGSRTIRRRLDTLGFTDEEKRRFVHLDVKRGRARFLTGDPDQLTAWLDAFEPTLVIIDSWSSVHGAANFGDVKDPDPVERVLAQVFRPLARDDAAVVVLDHVPKGQDAPDGYPFGSQRKFTGCDVVMEAKRSGKGRTKIIVRKDAPGDREHGVTIAEYVYGDTVAAIVPADPATMQAPGSRTFRPTGYMERVSKALEAAGDEGLTATQLDDQITGKAQHLRTARDVLVDEGFAKRSTSGADGVRFTATHFVSVRPYREADDETTHAT